MATSTSSETSSYEERKEKSISEFSQQDTIDIPEHCDLYGETYPIWDGDLEISCSERKEFAARIYEKEEEKDAKDRRIIPCHLLRVALIVG